MLQINFASSQKLSDVLFSQCHRHSWKKEIRVLATRVEPVVNLPITKCSWYLQGSVTDSFWEKKPEINLLRINLSESALCNGFSLYPNCLHFAVFYTLS